MSKKPVAFAPAQYQLIARRALDDSEVGTMISTRDLDQARVLARSMLRLLPAARFVYIYKIGTPELCSVVTLDGEDESQADT